MNYSSVDEAYHIMHVIPTTYSGTILYDPTCIFCNYKESIALLTDGSFRRCMQCRKEFKTRILTKPILNYNHSIHHLKPKTEE